MHMHERLDSLAQRSIFRPAAVQAAWNHLRLALSVVSGRYPEIKQEQMSYSLNSLTGGFIEAYIGTKKGDTRS